MAALSNLLRGAYTLLAPLGSDMLMPTPVEMFTFLGGIMLMIGMTFSYLNLTSQRLEQELTAAKVELHHQATTDHLTGLFNRRRFLELGEVEFEQARRCCQPMALFIIDIDHFKAINNGHGHLAGDRVLQLVAAAFRANLRGLDILARLGGDEFAVLLPVTTQADGKAMAEQLWQVVSEVSLQDVGILVRVTVSVGVAYLRDDDQGLDALLSRADVALYEAKQRGRNCVATQDAFVPLELDRLTELSSPADERRVV